mgnify:CR=1 FL=1
MLSKKREFYYLRLSKEDGDKENGSDEESYSITSQRKCIKNFLKKNGFFSDNFEEIIDDGYSGTNMDRPGMQRLLKMVRKGQVKTIIVRDLSRFARNYLEVGHYLEFVFPVYQVRFISIIDQFDSQSVGETTGGFEIAVKNLLNQMYSRDLSRKIKSVMDLKKINGEYVYGTAPYGYRKGEKKNTILIDPPAAKVVRQIFEWAATGMTVTQIARKLNEEHVTTPSVYLASVRGKYKTCAQWSYVSVHNILENRIYTGDTVPFKSHVVRVGSNLVRQIPEELREIIPDTHEAIISRELYYQAKKVIKSNKKSKPSSHKNPFTSLLICGSCGKRLIKGKAQNKNWICVSHRYYPDSDCKKVRFPEEKLKKIVLRAIITQCRLMDVKIKQIREENKDMKLENSLLQKELKKLKGQLDHLESTKLQYYEEYVQGAITKDEFFSKKQGTAKKVEELKLQINILAQKIEEEKKKEKDRECQISIVEPVTKYQEITELTPKLTKELIHEIVINPNGSIHIEWNFCDELMGKEMVNENFLDKVM